MAVDIECPNGCKATVKTHAIVVKGKFVCGVCGFKMVESPCVHQMVGNPSNGFGPPAKQEEDEFGLTQDEYDWVNRHDDNGFGVPEE